MKLQFEVELPDAPGELSRVLGIVASHGGNVQSVVHRHERVADGRLPVEIALDVEESRALKLLDALARTHRLLRVNREGGPVRTAVLLVGHVFEANPRLLLEAAFEAGATVDRVEARIAGRAQPSAVLCALAAEDGAVMGRALAALRERAAKHQVTVIEQVAGEGDE